MYIITKPGRGIQREVLAAYELNGDTIVFDRTRGDAEFIAHLEQTGVRLSTDDGITYVKPDAGKEFHNACLLAYSSAAMSCSDEGALDRLRRLFPSPKRRGRHSVPPHSAA